MKRLILILVVIVITVAQAMAAPLCPATGRVVDTNGKAVEFATVVLLQDQKQISGMATSQDGAFELKAEDGNYTLMVSYLGYEPVKMQIKIENQSNLGDIVLKNDATQIEGVVVKGQLIKRQADRFVVDVANSAAAIGKDGIELLEAAPGVWIDGEKISINGKQGSKIFVNDRELKMDTEQMLTYLRSLKAEEIQRIEVIPTVGADYDANSSGGAIHITLRRQREDGTQGNISLATRQGEFESTYSPSGRINYHTGKIDLFASAWGSFKNDKLATTEQTQYTNNASELNSKSNIKNKYNNGGGSVGGMYQINDKHSVGAEVEYWHTGGPTINNSTSNLMSVGQNTHTKSRYNSDAMSNNYSASFNYIWKIDSIGSTLKFLADYNDRTRDGSNNNTSHITSPSSSRDSLYRDRTGTKYNVTSASLALDKKLSTKWSLKAGAKYTNNAMKNDVLFEYMKADQWIKNQNHSFALNYTENIAAAYSIVSAHLGRWSLVAGLRGEYTNTKGKSGEVSQNYFSLFPNANISYQLSKDGAQSLIAQYSRTIARPNFSTLNPQRLQISDYTYQAGNPDLKPTYNQNISLTMVVKHKYTITAGMTLTKGEIQQAMQPDKDDPNLLYLGWFNFADQTNYYVSVNTPFQIRKWWTLNLNLTYLNQSQQMVLGGEAIRQNIYNVGTSTTFNLPAKFYIDINYFYQNRVQFGNCWISPTHSLSASIKKRFGEDWTLTFSARSLLDQTQIIGANGDGFTRRLRVKQPWNSRVFQLGVSYKFNRGKSFKSSSVEAASADQKSRM